MEIKGISKKIFITLKDIINIKYTFDTLNI